jgi:tyrosyl-tRNA synthetase
MPSPTDDVDAVVDTILANTVEAVTEEELREIARDPKGKRAYVGYEPSGVLHLGHMLTATKLMQLQEIGFETVILLADVHAFLNDKGTFDEIRAIADRMRDQFIAFGLDPKRTEFVLGSEFQLSEEFMLETLELTLNTTVNRAKRSMSEIAGSGPENVSQTVYPLMQALDIKALDIDLAIGGMEQRKVHMLARKVLPRIDAEPPTCLHTPLISDLDTGLGKMSSSEGTTISMEDTRADIERKINAAFCPPTRDPDPEVYLSGGGVNPADVELNNPVLQLFEFHVFPRFDSVTIKRPSKHGGNVTFESAAALEAAVESGAVHTDDLKTNLATYLDILIEPGREQLSATR